MISFNLDEPVFIVFDLTLALMTGVILIRFSGLAYLATFVSELASARSKAELRELVVPNVVFEAVVVRDEFD